MGLAVVAHFPWVGPPFMLRGIVRHSYNKLEEANEIDTETWRAEPDGDKK